MKNLNMMPLDTVDHLVHPEEFGEITLASSALKIFTDFKQHQPLVIERAPTFVDIFEAVKP